MKEEVFEEMSCLGGMDEADEQPIHPTSDQIEVNEEVETLTDIVDEFGNTIKKNKTTVLTEQVEEDFGSDSIAQAEELQRQRELEKQAEPIVSERVSEAVKQHNAKLKREAAELIYEHDTTILDNIKQARLEDRKERKRQKRKAKVKSVFWFAAIWGVCFILVTNDQVKPLVTSVASNLYQMVVDLVSDTQTSSNQVVDNSLEGLGKELNDANTKVIIQED